MKIIILLLISFNVFSGDLVIQTHEKKNHYNNCELIGSNISDKSFINEYYIKCKSEVARFESTSIYQNNDISRLFYNDLELTCPISEAVINSNKKFVIIFDCRVWL